MQPPTHSYIYSCAASASFPLHVGVTLSIVCWSNMGAMGEIKIGFPCYKTNMMQTFLLVSPLE